MDGALERVSAPAGLWALGTVGGVECHIYRLNQGGQTRKGLCCMTLREWY